MSNPNHKNHVAAGIRIVLIIIGIMIVLSVASIVGPFIIAALSAVLVVVLPIIGVCLLIAAGVWVLGFLFNTVKSVDVNKIKRKFKRS